MYDCKIKARYIYISYLNISRTRRQKHLKSSYEIQKTFRREMFKKSSPERDAVKSLVKCYNERDVKNVSPRDVFVFAVYEWYLEFWTLDYHISRIGLEACMLI